MTLRHSPCGVAPLSPEFFDRSVAVGFSHAKLNGSNFRIIYTPTQSECIQEDQVEINLDVEWAHAIAPGADIALIVPPSASLQDVDEAEFYAVNYGIANSISGSYGSPESETPASYLDTENLISEIAALSGISTNFSSGDNGDFVPLLPAPTVNAPADSPWATAVGGVSLALNADNSIAWQSGWGNDLTMVDLAGTLSDPPNSEAFGFYIGSGGGPSGSRWTQRHSHHRGCKRHQALHSGTGAGKPGAPCVRERNRQFPQQRRRDLAVLIGDRGDLVRDRLLGSSCK